MAISFGEIAALVQEKMLMSTPSRDLNTGWFNMTDQSTDSPPTCRSWDQHDHPLHITPIGKIRFESWLKFQKLQFHLLNVIKLLKNIFVHLIQILLQLSLICKISVNREKFKQINKTHQNYYYLDMKQLSLLHKNYYFKILNIELKFNLK